MFLFFNPSLERNESAKKACNDLQAFSYNRAWIKLYKSFTP